VDALTQRWLDHYRNGVHQYYNGVDHDGMSGFPAADWPDLPNVSHPADYDTDQDGMADAWELEKFGDLDQGGKSNSSSDADNDGYTDLEEFLNNTNPCDGNPAACVSGR